MRKESINFGRLVVQSLLAIGIHFVFAAVVVGIAYVMTSDPGYVAQEALDAANGTENAQLAIDYALEDGFALLMNWTAQVFIASIVLAIIFLASTASLSPQIEEDARSRKPLWAFLLIALIVLSMIMWWINVLDSGMAALLVGTAYIVTGLLGGLLLVLAFHFATATCVKPTMQRSVPLSAFLPSFGK